VNEARGAKDTLGILFWGVMHKRFGVITSWDFCYDLKSLLSNVILISCAIDLRRKAKKSVKLMMEMLFEMELELILVPQPSGSSEHVADEAVHKELGDNLVRAATTASSLEAEQDSGGGPRCQETIGDTITQTRFENVSKLSNDSLLARGNTLQSDEDRLKLDELMALCTTLQSRVLDLEKTKTTQANEIASLKRRVKKLEKKRSSRTHKLKRLYKVGLTARVESSGDEEDLGEDASKQGRRINAIDADEDITLVNVQDDADNEMFDVDALNGEEVFVAGQNENVVEEVVDVVQVSTAATTVTITTEEITLAQALKALKTSKPKVKGIVFQEPRKLKRKKEANISLIEEWDDIQAKIDVDYQLAERLQAQEQEELFVKEKEKLFQQLLEKRRKHFPAKSAEEKRNKPPTQAQQRKIMCTYLKNMKGKKLKDLKNKSFDSIQKMFDRAFKRVNIFVDFITDLVEGSSNRAVEELEQKSTKKQKVDEDKDTTELQSLMEIIPDEEEVAIDVVPLATNQMLKSFDREDLKDLYKLVKARYGSTRPVESMDYLLWNDLKTMFEPHVEDAIWRNQQGYKVLEWKLYDSYMLNKKLQVDYFSKMAYQLLKLLTK
ncbi:hypothetical protein Tco_0371677, partial [Tanacetum coccineum]